MRRWSTSNLRLGRRCIRCTRSHAVAQTPAPARSGAAAAAPLLQQRRQLAHQQPADAPARPAAAPQAAGSGWRAQQGKGVPPPSHWGRPDEAAEQAAAELTEPGDSFNPLKAKGRLSVRTSSPWLWTMRGMEEDFAPHTTRPDIARGLRALAGAFFPPASFKHELPRGAVPEIAFCGRSNVGKSTLVGTLINNARLVRASKQPGCTRTVNYFGVLAPPRLAKKGASELDRAAAFFVDLPGYGFAKAPPAEVAAWTAAVKGFVTRRDCSVLRRTFVLVDARRGVRAADDEFMSLLDAHGVSHQIVLTKADVASRTELRDAAESAMRSAARHAACFPAVHVLSGKEGRGVPELLDTIYYITGLANNNNYALDTADLV